jgi:hypothetical protein
MAEKPKETATSTGTGTGTVAVPNDPVQTNPPIKPK